MVRVRRDSDLGDFTHHTRTPWQRPKQTPLTELYALVGATRLCQGVHKHITYEGMVPLWLSHRFSRLGLTFANWTESPGSPPPKRQRLQTPVLESTPRRGSSPPDVRLPDPLPSPTPASSSKDPAISGAVHDALSAPWTGPGEFHYGDEDTFVSSDTDDETAQTVPIAGSTESDSSNTDSEADLDVDMDNDDFGSGGSDIEDTPDVFETNADLNAAEYCE